MLRAAAPGAISASSRSGARPGLTATKSTPSSSSAVKAPPTNSASGTASRSANRRCGSVRVSATRTRAPQRASHCAIARPDSPSPSTSAVLPS
jgi:hypothetical protein